MILCIQQSWANLNGLRVQSLFPLTSLTAYEETKVGYHGLGHQRMKCQHESTLCGGYGTTHSSPTIPFAESPQAFAVRLCVF